MKRNTAWGVVALATLALIGTTVMAAGGLRAREQARQGAGGGACPAGMQNSTPGANCPNVCPGPGQGQGNGECLRTQQRERKRDGSCQRAAGVEPSTAASPAASDAPRQGGGMQHRRGQGRGQGQGYCGGR